MAGGSRPFAQKLDLSGKVKALSGVPTGWNGC